MESGSNRDILETDGLARLFRRLREEKRLDPKLWREFHCACCRDIWSYIIYGESRNSVETAERFARGGAALEELQEAYRDAKVIEDERWQLVKSMRDNSEPDEWIWPVSEEVDDAWVAYSTAAACSCCASPAKEEVLFTTIPDSAASVRPWANARIQVQSRFPESNGLELRRMVLNRWQEINRGEEDRYSQLLLQLLRSREEKGKI